MIVRFLRMDIEHHPAVTQGKELPTHTMDKAKITELYKKGVGKDGIDYQNIVSNMAELINDVERYSDIDRCVEK